MASRYSLSGERRKRTTSSSLGTILLRRVIPLGYTDSNMMSTTTSSSDFEEVARIDPTIRRPAGKASQRDGCNHEKSSQMTPRASYVRIKSHLLIEATRRVTRNPRCVHLSQLAVDPPVTSRIFTPFWAQKSYLVVSVFP
jgi:hypothetical protein